MNLFVREEGYNFVSNFSRYWLFCLQRCWRNNERLIPMRTLWKVESLYVGVAKRELRYAFFHLHFTQNRKIQTYLVTCLHLFTHYRITHQLAIRLIMAIIQWQQMFVQYCSNWNECICNCCDVACGCKTGRRANTKALRVPDQKNTTDAWSKGRVSTWSVWF